MTDQVYLHTAGNQQEPTVVEPKKSPAAEQITIQDAALQNIGKGVLFALAGKTIMENVCRQFTESFHTPCKLPL